LVTGPTGSGKSTTLAAMIDAINSERSEHIITIEDPVEFIHPHKRCLVNQREVGADTHSFKKALKYILRQDPDVVLLGELRDVETIEAALTIAETGHLCFATHQLLCTDHQSDYRCVPQQSTTAGAHSIVVCSRRGSFPIFVAQRQRLGTSSGLGNHGAEHGDSFPDSRR